MSLVDLVLGGWWSLLVKECSTIWLKLRCSIIRIKIQILERAPIIFLICCVHIEIGVVSRTHQGRRESLKMSWLTLLKRSRSWPMLAHRPSQLHSIWHLTVLHHLHYDSWLACSASISPGWNARTWYWLPHWHQGAGYRKSEEGGDRGETSTCFGCAVVFEVH